MAMPSWITTGFQAKRPNFVTEWLILLLHTWERLGSKLCLRSSYPEDFVVFLSPFRHMLGIDHKIRP
jgi:hypothetical protein